MSVVDAKKTITEIQNSRTLVEGQTRVNEVVYLDFKDWKNCLFEKCRIIIEYGIFSLVDSNFVDCRFEAISGSPAEAILKLDQLTKKKE